MKKKIVLETPEQVSARKEKERRELARWEREQQRPKTKGYIWYTMAILAMIYVVDEITALIGTQMQPDIAQHLFDGKLSILSLCSAFSLPPATMSGFWVLPALRSPFRCWRQPFSSSSGRLVIPRMWI